MKKRLRRFKHLHCKTIVHRHFDKLWQKGPYTRNESYQMLAILFGVEKYHIANSTLRERYKIKKISRLMAKEFSLK